MKIKAWMIGAAVSSILFGIVIFGIPDGTLLKDCAHLIFWAFARSALIGIAVQLGLKLIGME